MPTATPFTALGKGNGFPSCLPKVDVSEYDNVEEMTLGEAMKIFWNLASISYSASSSGADLNVSISGTSTATEVPSERVCNSVSFPSDSQSDESEGDPPAGFDVIFAFVSFNASVAGVKRLYDGDITNEENFIGYGIASLCSVTADYIDLLAGHQDTKQVSLHSYVDNDTDATITTTEVGGVTFLERTFLIGDGDATVGAEITSLDFYTY